MLDTGPANCHTSKLPISRQLRLNLNLNLLWTLAKYSYFGNYEYCILPSDLHGVRPKVIRRSIIARSREKTF